VAGKGGLKCGDGVTLGDEQGLREGTREGAGEPRLGGSRVLGELISGKAKLFINRTGDSGDPSLEISE